MVNTPEDDSSFLPTLGGLDEVFRAQDKETLEQQHRGQDEVVFFLMNAMRQKPQLFERLFPIAQYYALRVKGADTTSFLADENIANTRLDELLELLFPDRPDLLQLFLSSKGGLLLFTNVVANLQAQVSQESPLVHAAKAIQAHSEVAQEGVEPVDEEPKGNENEQEVVVPPGNIADILPRFVSEEIFTLESASTLVEQHPWLVDWLAEKVTAKELREHDGEGYLLSNSLVEALGYDGPEYKKRRLLNDLIERLQIPKLAAGDLDFVDIHHRLMFMPLEGAFRILNSVESDKLGWAKTSS